MKTRGPTPFSNETDSDVASGRNALNWILEKGGAEHVARRARHRARQLRRNRMIQATAAVAVLFVVGFLWRSPASRRLVPTGELPASVVLDAPRKEVLADGSVVEMKDGARILVDYQGHERRVVLTEGEALFQVVSSPGRPFIVTASGIQVRALGTAFSVSVTAGAVDVLVTEGTVRVDHDVVASEGNPTLATVSAGNRVSVAKAASPTATLPQSIPVESVSDVEMAEMLAWRVPRIEFSGTPLSEAIPVFNRYSPVRLTLGDASLGDLQLSGWLRPDRVKPLLLLLQNEFGIEGEPRSETEIVLRKNSRNSRQ